MAYGISDYVGMIDKYKDTNPALAYAIYNGVTGMGGNGLANPGNMSTALRNAWGEDAAKNWVNSGTTKYGNTLFDPKTGQWSGMGEAQGQGGMLEGWDASKFDPNAQWSGTMNYTPTTTTGTATVSAAGATRPGGAPNPGALPTMGTPAQAGGTSLAALAGTGGASAPLPASSTSASSAGSNATLEAEARKILGSYLKTKPDGSPDWAAMSGANGQAFWDSLPDEVKNAMQAASLGKRMQAMANGNAYGTPAGAATTYTPPAYAGTLQYTAPTAPEDTSTPWDFFDEEGYQFRKKQGMDRIENSAAARGGLLSGATLKALADYNSGLASSEYGAANDRWMRDKQFNRGKFESDRGFGRGVYESDRDTGRRNFESDRALGYDIFKDARNFDESGRRFDYGVTKDDRDFNESQRRYDQGFNYGVATGDRDTQLNTLKFLAGLGSSNTSSAANLDQWIADYVARNNLTGAGAGAQGTVGSANNINQVISQLLQAISNSRLINSVTP